MTKVFCNNADCIHNTIINIDDTCDYSGTYKNICSLDEIVLEDAGDKDISVSGWYVCEYQGRG